MEPFKFLENAREAAYCLLFGIGVFKGCTTDLLTLCGLVLLSIIPSCDPVFPGVL